MVRFGGRGVLEVRGRRKLTEKMRRRMLSKLVMSSKLDCGSRERLRQAPKARIEEWCVCAPTGAWW